MVNVILLEDNQFLREKYTRSLIENGFTVTSVEDGSGLLEKLVLQKFEIIVSDTDLLKLDGPIAVKQAYDEGSINDDTLVIGMSSDSDNKLRWKGIANFDCFYEKDYLENYNLGVNVKNCWNAFNSGVIGWRRKL